MVNTGRDKGVSGKVVRINKDSNSVVVEGVNKRTRNIKARQGQPGDRVSVSLPIDVSNVSILDPKSGAPTRIGYKVENGIKIRIAKASGAEIANDGGEKGAKKSARKKVDSKTIKA